jgi:hypothetical protein
MVKDMVGVMVIVYVGVKEDVQAHVSESVWVTVNDGPGNTVFVFVKVGVDVRVKVGVAVFVTVAVHMHDMVTVGVAVKVGVPVRVKVGVIVRVTVDVHAHVVVRDGVAVRVGVKEGEHKHVLVRDGVTVNEGVFVDVQVKVGVKVRVEQMFDISTVETIVGEPLKLFNVALLCHRQVVIGGCEMCPVIGISTHPENPGLINCMVMVAFFVP